MTTPTIDSMTVVAVLLLAASVVTSIKVVWGPIRKFNNFIDLMQRELTGWTDDATGFQHPSLRKEVIDIHNRLTKVEEATKQLTPNSGSHVADAVRRTAEKVEWIEKRLNEVHPEGARQ